MIARHEFIPDVIWVYGDSGWLVPLSRAEQPEKWLELCASDEAVITQVDDGEPDGGDRGFRATSSSSAPPIMAEMIEALDPESGMEVLEIGTGTGYNAAVLAGIVGPEHVTTVEVDAEVAGRARRALDRTGFDVTTVIADGALGYPPNAPYDRLISTAAAHTIPYPWIQQVRTGGRIVVPVNLPFGATGALLTLTVHDDGTASGPFSGRPAFMLLRSQRPPRWGDVDGPYQESVTRLYPCEPLEGGYHARFVVAVLVPDCQDGRTFEFEEADGEPAICLQDEKSASWAAFTPGKEEHRVRQHGPRRLWDELESAYLWWTKSGRPNQERFGMTVTNTGQHVWLDSPTNPVHPEDPPSHA